MQSFPPTVIIRHRLENLKKCSLSGLEGREDLLFLRYPFKETPILSNYLILALDAPILTREDKDRGLLILDATWRYAAKMMKPFLDQTSYVYRSLPSHFRTAYPRRQQDCPDPIRGLASVEALYLCYDVLERPTEGLLDHYYWKNDFLNTNSLESRGASI
jgi:pre-rRNA-processing protein TSR3